MARPVETFSMAFVTAPNHETAKYSFSIVVPFTFKGCINYRRISQYGRLSNCLVFRSLASGLVSGKLAACVNILPGVTSVYEWEGKVVVVLLMRVVSLSLSIQVNEDPEVLMMIKTRTSRIPELTQYVQSTIFPLVKSWRYVSPENHPYDVPEVITTSIEGGSAAYLSWLGEMVPENSSWRKDVPIHSLCFYYVIQCK